MSKNDGGWILPDIVDPPRKCICIPVPNEPAHRQAFFGALIQLGYQFNWQRDPEHKALPTSIVWMSIILEAMERFYSGVDYMCFSCEELAACMQPLLDAQTTAIMQNITNLQQYGTETPGVPMTPEQLAANIAAGSNPGCDLDILWAQCLAIVQFTNRAITDTLEKVEVAANVVELAELIGEIPILGWAAELSGTSLVVEAIDYFQEAIAESYSGQYTEAVEVELACQLFCICRSDCVISVDRLYDMTAGNLGSLIPSDIGDLVDLIEIVAGIDFDGSEVVDVCFFFAWGTAKLAQFFFGDALASTTLNLLVELAVDDASADWLLLCDCGSDWNYQLDSTTDPVWVTFAPIEGATWGTIGGNVLTQTTDVVFGQDVTGIYLEIEFPTVQNLTGLRINALGTVGVDLADLVNAFWSLDDTGGSPLLGGDLPIVNDPWEVFEGFNVSGVKKVRIQYLFLGTTQEMTWQPVQLFGFGVNPFV